MHVNTTKNNRTLIPVAVLYEYFKYFTTSNLEYVQMQDQLYCFHDIWDGNDTTYTCGMDFTINLQRSPYTKLAQTGLNTAIRVNTGIFVEDV